MNEPKSLDAELIGEIIVQAVKLGALPAEAIERARASFEWQANNAAGSSAADRFDVLEQMATEMQLAIVAPSPSEHLADFRRRQMRARARHDARPEPEAP